MIYMSVCGCIYIYIYIYIYMYIHIQMFHASTSLSDDLCVVYVSVFACVYVYIHTRICIYIYTYIQKSHASTFLSETLQSYHLLAHVSDCCHNVCVCVCNSRAFAVPTMSVYVRKISRIPLWCGFGVALVSRIDKIINLFCKRAL